MPEPSFHIAGIVLAAGLGSRFDPTGQRYKLTQTLADGRTVLGAVCETMRQHVDSLTVVDGERGHELDAVFDELLATPAGPMSRGGILRRVHCANARAGMGASLKAAVSGAPRDAHAWLVALGDMPYIAADTIAAVCVALRQGASLVRPVHDGQPGHPVGLAASWRAELMNLPDSAGAVALMKRHGDALVRLNVRDAGCVMDIDVPGDMQIKP